MANLILNFIDDYWTMEEAKEYKEAIDFIDGIHEDWTDNLEIIIRGSNDDVTVNEITLRIKDFIRNQFTELLGEIGFICTEDFIHDPITLYRIYSEAISIENNEQIEFSLSILEADKDNVITFYELLSTVGGLLIDESEFNQTIEKISNFTRERLVNTLRGKELVKIEEKQEFDLIRASKNIKEFTKAVNDDSFYAIQLIRSGVDLGIDFKNYLSIYGKEVFEMDLKEMAYNLYLFALMSNDGTDNPVLAVESHLNNYIFDPNSYDVILRAVQDIQIKTRGV
jgi:hypothetical protein|nr:MAG TPA: hypothetical protein [Caudoviricetes sp.]